MAFCLFSPQDYQVFQRNESNEGNVIFSGAVSCEITHFTVEIFDEVSREKIEDIRWEHHQESHFFLQMVLPAGGWYIARIFAFSKHDKSLISLRFGVGEVFVIAGQSNSTNYGEELSEQSSGMVACFAENTWSLAKDPLPGAHDISNGGSPWLFFGDVLSQKLRVPVGIAITGHGGTKIKEWLPNDEYYGQSEEKKGLFNWLMIRIQQLGLQGFRALLWHQGESDVGNGTKQDDYFCRLKTIIYETRKQCKWHIPWFVALVSYRNPQDRSCSRIREAQKKICNEGIAFLGPDTDVLTEEYRDLKGVGIHFNLKGLEAHGEMWAAKIEKWFKNHKI